MNQRTHLMAPEGDESTSGGSASVAGNEAPANTAPARPAIDAATVAEIAKAVRDSVFADLRRTGALKANPKAASAAPEDAPATAPAADLGKLRALDRALTRSGFATRLSDRQMQRLEETFIRESPESADAFIAEWFEGLGGSPTTAATTPATKQPSNATPVSNGGTPPTPRAPIEEQDLMSLSETDRQHLRRTKGEAWFVQTFRKQMQGKRLSIR